MSQNNSRQRSFSYNAFSQLVSATNPESGTITYDNDGNILTKTSYAENQTDRTPTYGQGSVSITLSRYCQEGDCTSGTATISVGSYGAQVSYTARETTSSLASALAAQLSLSSSPVTATASGSTVNITSKVSGTSGNYSLSTSITGNNGIPASYVLTPSGSTLTGGSNPPTVTIAYDKLNRVTSKTYTDGTPTVSYGYDGVAPSGCSPTLTISNGIYERTGMCDGPGWEAWSYNPTGHLADDRRSTSNLAPVDTLYVPNLDGSVASITYPFLGRAITYTPGGAGLPLAASDGTNAYAGSAHYAPQGALAYVQNGTNLYTTEIYNSRLQPCWIYATTGSALTWNTTACTTTDPGPANIIDLQYNFDLAAGDNGNVIGITNNRDTTRSQAFSYDALNRLLTAETTSTYSTSSAHCWGEAYFYDNQPSGSGAWGNLTSIGAASSSYNGCTQEGLSVTATTNNQISGFCYDAAGNLLQESTCPAGPPYTYSYNAEHQVTSTGGVTYSYDGDGKRIEKSGGKIYWYGGGSDALDETDLSGDTNNSTFSEYVDFGGRRTARRDYLGNIFYYVSDHLGTSREMVQSGQTSPCYDADFYPFGGERAYATTCTQNYKFTGKERDSESGLDNFGARYDSSSMGRFMSPDPLGGHQEDPQTLNKYAYVRNNPTTLTDPTGLDFWLQGGNACGQNNVTCDKKGYVLDSNNNRVLIGNSQLRDSNSGDSANFDTNGVHITTAQGTFTGQFAAGTPDTRVEGAGDFAGLHAVFNSDCGGTCNAGGALFGTKAQFDALLPKLLKNPGADNIDPFHPGTDQYRGGNKEGPDAHLSFKASDDPNQRDPFHFDNRYPYGSAGGFGEHTGGVFHTIWNSIEGKQGPPLPKDIPIASVPQRNQ